KRIVEAAASTIEDVVLKVAMTASLLLEGDLRVGLTPQCLEECDRALAQKGDGEQCLKALESELWAFCERVEYQTAALDPLAQCPEFRLQSFETLLHVAFLSERAIALLQALCE